MDKVKVKLDVRDLILNRIKSEGRQLTWLAETTGINYDNLYACLKRKTIYLTKENLTVINTALGTDFTLE